MTISSSNTLPSSWVTRQQRLHDTLQSQGMHSLILNAGPSLVYLTGLHFHLSERPVLVIFPANADPLIVLPELELEKLKGLPYSIQPFPYGEDPSQWDAAFGQAIKTAGLDGKKNGVEPQQLRLLEYRILTQAAPHASFPAAETIVSSLRMYKDDTEIAAMRIAAQIAERALAATLTSVKIGVTETELASELTLQLLRAGCDPQVPFSPIISSGLNSANPHATPSDRKLSSGDLLVIDWGASYQGYLSDITRTFAIGKVDPEYLQIGRIVHEANSIGRSTARPGISASDLDGAVRAVIDSGGYAKYFTHRTGHGLGMEGHEHPYIRSGNPLHLEAGMAFTIEPGIYLPGRNGVRIEDDVIITATGADCLTGFPREVVQLV